MGTFISEGDKPHEREKNNSAMSSTNPTKITTEWDDLQVQHGNFAAPQEELKEADLTKMIIDFAEQKDYVADLSLNKLNELEDTIDEDKLDHYRRMRIEEMRQKRLAYKFGEVYNVTKAEYQSAVTDSSEDHFVICMLYSRLKKETQVMIPIMKSIAKKFGDVKFLMGEVTDILTNYPAEKCPTVIIYHKKKCVKQVMGTEFWGGKLLSLDSFEWTLSEMGIVKSDLEHDPTKDQHSNAKRTGGIRYNEKRDGYGDNNEGMHVEGLSESKDYSDSDDRDDRGYMSTAIKGRNERY